MKSVLAFLGERMRERSSQVQLAALVLTGLVATGIVSMDQVHALAGQWSNMLLLLGPLAGVLVPERRASAEEVYQAAETLIASDPRFAAARDAVEGAASAFEAATRGMQR